MSERHEQAGLALRVQRGTRTISAQHRQLDDFYLHVAAALDGGPTETARAVFLRFSDALEAHFALEDGLYFPALRGLRPGFAGDVERLCDEHQQLRETVVRGAHSIESGSETGARLLHQFAGVLAEHEGRERDSSHRSRSQPERDEEPDTSRAPWCSSSRRPHANPIHELEPCGAGAAGARLR